MEEEVDRIKLSEWLIHEALCLCKDGVSIAVDFDSTLCLTDGFPNILGPNGNCFHILRKWQRMGCKILLHTMRYGKDLEEAIVWCSNCKMFFDGINHNPCEEARDPEYQGKMYALFYIDDKAIGTPLLHSKYERIRDHVNWAKIDEIYTPLIEQLMDMIKDSNNITNKIENA